MRPAILRFATVADKHAALKHSKDAARPGPLVDDLTRAKQDARAKLHPRLLFTWEQHLQSHFRGKNPLSINAAQQWRENMLGRPLPVRISTAVPLAIPTAAAGSSSGGSPGSFAGALKFLAGLLCCFTTCH